MSQDDLGFKNNSNPPNWFQKIIDAGTEKAKDAAETIKTKLPEVTSKVGGFLKQSGISVMEGAYEIVARTTKILSVSRAAGQKLAHKTNELVTKQFFVSDSQEKPIPKANHTNERYESEKYVEKLIDQEINVPINRKFSSILNEPNLDSKLKGLDDKIAQLKQAEKDARNVKTPEELKKEEEINVGVMPHYRKTISTPKEIIQEERIKLQNVRTHVKIAIEKQQGVVSEMTTLRNTLMAGLGKNKDLTDDLSLLKEKIAKAKDLLNDPTIGADRRGRIDKDIQSSEEIFYLASKTEIDELKTNIQSMLDQNKGNVTALKNLINEKIANAKDLLKNQVLSDEKKSGLENSIKDSESLLKEVKTRLEDNFSVVVQYKLKINQLLSNIQPDSPQQRKVEELKQARDDENTKANVDPAKIAKLNKDISIAEGLIRIDESTIGFLQHKINELEQLE